MSNAWSWIKILGGEFTFVCLCIYAWSGFGMMERILLVIVYAYMSLDVLRKINGKIDEAMGKENKSKPAGQDQPAGSWASFNGLTYRSGSLPTPPVMAKEYASGIDWTNDEAVVRAAVPRLVFSLGDYEQPSAGIWTDHFGYFMGANWEEARQYPLVSYFESLNNPSYGKIALPISDVQAIRREGELAGMRKAVHIIRTEGVSLPIVSSETKRVHTARFALALAKKLDAILAKMEEVKETQHDSK